VKTYGIALVQFVQNKLQYSLSWLNFIIFLSAMLWSMQFLLSIKKSQVSGDRGNVWSMRKVTSWKDVQRGRSSQLFVAFPFYITAWSPSHLCSNGQMMPIICNVRGLNCFAYFCVSNISDIFSYWKVFLQIDSIFRQRIESTVV